MVNKISRLLIPFIALITLSLGLSSVSTAQSPTPDIYLPIISYNYTGWIGPYGGTITSIVYDPSNPHQVYSGSFGSGVFKSTDGGMTWNSTNAGLTNLYVYSLAIDPTNPLILYAGTYHDQVFKSTDGGKSWKWSGTGMQYQAIVYSMAVDPVTPSVIYAATRGVSNNDKPPWNGVVYKSTDGGQTWNASLVNLGGWDVQDWAYSIAINPNLHDQVFIASHENGPLRSNDAGASWVGISVGIQDPSGRAITICPQKDFSYILYHGVWHFDSVYKSEDSGASWYPIDNGISDVEVYSMALDPYSCDSLYMGTFSHGILKTTDGGKSWQGGGLFPDGIYSTVINPWQTSNLFAGTEGDGLYHSTDFSASWQRSNNGLNNAMVTSLIQSPTGENIIYASLYGGGVFLSGNRGASWEEMNKGLDDKMVHQIILDPAHPNILYALTDQNGLYLYDFSIGTGWAPVGVGLPLTETVQPAYTPDHPLATLDMLESFSLQAATNNTSTLSYANLLEMVYAPSDAHVAYLGTRSAGVYRSSNSGSTWQSAGLEGLTIQSLAVDPTNSNLVYAATNIADSIKISTNGGASWTDAYQPGSFYSLAASPKEAGVVFAGTNAGLFRYTSGTWTSLGLSDKTVTAITVDPIRQGVIYAGTTSGAYYSPDGGHTWYLVDRQLHEHTILGITIDSKSPDRVYFATKTHGVFVTAIQIPADLRQ